MDLRNILAKELAGSNTKLLTGLWLGHISPDKQWIKWLEYKTETEKALKEKDKKLLSKEEIQELDYYHKKERIIKLLKIYGTNKITKSEYIEVYQFMKKNNIEEYMLSNLTKKELETAKEKIAYYSKFSSQELREKIKFESTEDNYSSLSMLDAFILYFITKISIQKENKKITQEIDSQIKANEAAHQKGLYYAKNSLVAK